MGRGMPPPFDWTRCKPGWLLRPPIRRTTQPTWSSRRTGLIEPGMAFPRPLRVFPYDFSVFLLPGMVLERPGRHPAGNRSGAGAHSRGARLLRDRRGRYDGGPPIGDASCRVRVCRTGKISEVDVLLKKKQ